MKIILSFILVACFSTALFDQETEVIICKGSSAYAYHDHFCHGLKQCRAGTEKLSLTKAKSIGRKACGYCYGTPGVAPKTGTKTNTDKPLQSTRSAQCSATTKKGTRCSRNVRSGYYCWQHGG